VRRLDGLSAYFVYADRPRYYQHTLKVAIINYGDHPKTDYETFVAGFEEGVKLVPMLKWKLAFVPLGLNHPVWVQDTGFDLRYHIHHVECPAPGDDRALSALISQLYAYPMDKSAPLWMCWLVDGLEGNRRAVVTLLHHAYTDGAGASRMLQRIFAPEEHRGCPVATMDPHEEPTGMRLLWNGLVDLPRLFIREVPSILHGMRVMKQYNGEVREKGLEVPPTGKDAPLSPFNTVMSHRRTFAFRTFSMGDIHDTSKRLGATVNDLFVSVCAGALRRFMQGTEFDPDRGPLVCTLPIGARPPPEEDDLVGNHVVNASMWVPVHIADPAERLKFTHQKSLAMKSYLDITREANLFHVLEVMPPLYPLMLERRSDREKGDFSIFGNMALSNVAGPREALRVGNAELENWLSVGQVGFNVGLNITCWSYTSHFNVCLMAEAKVLPDGWVLLDYIGDALDEYRRLDAPGIGSDASDSSRPP